MIRTVSLQHPNCYVGPRPEQLLGSMATVIFGRRKARDSGAAVAEPATEGPEIVQARELVAEGRHFEAIDLLNEANRRSRSTAFETEIRRIRNVAGMTLLE